MKKILIIAITISLFLILTGFINKEDEKVNIKSKKPMTTEEIYKSMNFIEANKAITQYEKIVDAKVYLPKKMPFKISNKFGKIDDDNRLILAFLGEDKGDVLKLYVNPNKPFEKNSNFTLKDGTNALIKKIGSSNKSQTRVLLFQKDKFQYTIGITNSEKYDENVIIKVAESIN
ncbi:hypothetical protein [Aquibacillus salsiterrae]|uniref:DUF4367 domain-containing protein n=1 Tax=Aquibacillus salsiterrae TaxID=2950439 RepID=A0A9X3WGM0_9BACI|nr:hypothetical protein [Aquibacillus salsiterrae]MDC3418648.1 hypothetical protein [Aquibacillus salsiterrae]